VSVWRILILLALLTGGIAGVAVLVLWSGPGRDAERDIAKSLDPAADPPFTFRLSGPLWRDRTLKSEDGAPDHGYVTGDERLDVFVRGANGTPAAAAELLVDGRLQQRVRPPCPQRRCPTSLRLALRPRLIGPVSANRRVQVRVSDRQASGAGADVDPHVSVATFVVHVVRRLPPVREGTAQPARKSATGSRMRTRALKAVSALRRRGFLNALLGSARLRVAVAGELSLNGRPVGASLLLELTRPRLNVGATVPAYIPAANSSGYQPQTVSLRATVLHDLLVDVDLRHDRVIALEPGPRSQTKTWAPSAAATPAGAEDED
jgi:hypothetical protein